jgi:predicted nicotinamide N-methyase
MNSISKKRFVAEIGKLRIKLSRVEDPEKLFEEFISSDSSSEDVKDERIPYWSELWPSAVGLAEYLAENPALIKGKRVVEIGCGLGLPGIVAGLLGGKVVLTDYLKPALKFAADNWKLNIASPPETCMLDWRSPGDFPPADVLLASDVAYESRAFVPLLKAMKTLVVKKGIVLLSEPNRKFTTKFFDSLKGEFSIAKSSKMVNANDVKNKISVYHLTRK